MSKQASPRPAFWRNFPRLVYLYALIPLSLLIGLYAGYGRFARLELAQGMRDPSPGIIHELTSDTLGIHSSIELPTLPFCSIARPAEYGDAFSMYEKDAARVMLSRWKGRQDIEGKRAYFARYALLLGADSPEFERVMRQGERDDPDNALYPVLLANHYFALGLDWKRVSGARDKWDYSVSDRPSLDKGIAKVRIAFKKRCFNEYAGEAMRLEAQYLPRPRLMEDYLANNNEYLNAYDEFSALHHLERNIYNAARTLAAEGQKREAEALMDSWQPFTRMLLEYAEGSAVFEDFPVRYAASSAGRAASLYELLGAEKKRAKALSVQKFADKAYSRLHDNAWSDDDMRVKYGAHRLFINYADRYTPPLKASLTPQRMHEHLVIEDLALVVVITILMLFIVALWLLGDYWHVRLRKTEGPPRTFIPTWREAARILLLGVALPVLAYYLYSRLPLLGGRDFSWGSPQEMRFKIELIALGALIILLTAYFTRRWVRIRCAQEEIDTPKPWAEAREAWIVRVLLAPAVILLCYYISDLVRYDANFYLGELWTYPATYTFFGSLAIFGLFWLLLRKIWITEKFGSPQRRGLIIAFGLLVAFKVSLIIYGLLKIHDIPIDRDFDFPFFAMTALIFLALIKLFKPTPYGHYYGTLARTLVPVYACAILFLALAVLPAVRAREAYWLRQNPNNPWAAAGMQTAVDGDREIIEKLRGMVE